VSQYLDAIVYIDRNTARVIHFSGTEQVERGPLDDACVGYLQQPS
jgi:hypothetical protein